MNEDHCKVSICSGCVRKYYTTETQNIDTLMTYLNEELKKHTPDTNWKIEKQSCFRFCPENKISLSVNGTLSMSREATYESLIREIKSIVNYKKLNQIP